MTAHSQQVYTTCAASFKLDPIIISHAFHEKSALTQHAPAVTQVKKKMTCEEFIRNNRGINAGENLPQDFLSAVYESISRNEIRITSDSGGQPSPVLWADLGQQSRGSRGRMLELGPVGESSFLHEHAELCMSLQLGLRMQVH